MFRQALVIPIQVNLVLAPALVHHKRENTLGQSRTQPHTKQRGVQSTLSRVRSGNSPFSGMALGRRVHEI
jgi:hypothetical protein